MIKKVKKKTCSKAKREREILADLDVINRRLGVLAVMGCVEHEPDKQVRIEREVDHLHAAEKRLEGELRDLWTEPGTKKKRARAKGDRS